MAFPVVTAPYGLRPMSLIGALPYSGATREYDIPNGYNTNIMYGDVVGLTRGQIQRVSVTTGAAGSVVGVFLGCRYTDPVSKTTVFNQMFPAGMQAGDAVAIVVDDPNVVFKGVMCSTGTTLASASRALIGQNLAMINNAGNAATEMSTNAILSPTATPATTAALPLRVMGLVKEAARQLGTATYSSISTNTVTCSALPVALPIGTDVGSLDARGQYVSSGSFLTAAAAAGATSFVLNQPPIATLNTQIVFMLYPEIYVKLNMGQHGYLQATSVA